MRKVLLFAGVWLAATNAWGALITLPNDDAFRALNRAESFVAEARFGNSRNNGDWEIGVGVPNTATPDQIAQHSWDKGESFDFSLTVTDGNTFTFTVDGETLTWNEDADPISALAIRAAAKPRNNNSTTTTTLSNLKLDGVALSIDSLSGDNDANYLYLTGLTSNNFTLTGTASFSWTNRKPRGSRASFQIKGIQAVIPTPGALLLGGVGLAALAARRRLG